MPSDRTQLWEHATQALMPSAEHVQHVRCPAGQHPPDTPTPCKPPDTAYPEESPPNLPPACSTWGHAAGARRLAQYRDRHRWKQHAFGPQSSLSRAAASIRRAARREPRLQHHLQHQRACNQQGAADATSLNGQGKNREHVRPTVSTVSSADLPVAGWMSVGMPLQRQEQGRQGYDINA